MKETARWEVFHRTKPPSRGTLLLIAAALVLPTNSYFLQEVRFWLVVLAILVGLGVLILAVLILLQEFCHRALYWMKLRVGRITAVGHGRLILRSAMARYLPHH